MKPRHLFRQISSFLLLVLWLVARGPLSPTTTPLMPTATTVATATPTPTSLRTITPARVASPTPVPTPKVSDAVIIGLLQSQEPDNLWPLGSLTYEQILVQNAVMEPAMTTRNYDYQAVLFEKVPTLENGGAVLTRTVAPIDPATGAITVTDTGVYTNVRQMIVTFHLRPNIYWSDGQPVTAVDSVFGYNVACSPDSGYADYSRCEKVERYEAVDERTIRVTFKPDVLELDYFTYYWNFMPEHAWSTYTPEEMSTTEQIARKFSPSYGPYMVQDWTPGESITLVRNPYYKFHGKGYPVVDKIIFKFLPDSYNLLAQLLAGQVDLVDRLGLQGIDTELLLALEENGMLHFHTQPSLLWENIVMNLNDPKDLTQPHPVLGDLRVRQAIAYGTNREAMAQAVYKTPVSVLNSWIPSDHWAYGGDDALTLYPYNPQKASALLEEAGWILADDGYRYKDGQRLELRLYLLAGQPFRETIAHQFEGALEPLGVSIELVRVREEDWYGEQSPLTRREFDLIEFAWVAGLEPDGQVSYTCAEVPTEENGWRGQNYGGWCNATATASLLGATRELYRQRRKEYYRVAQEEFTAEVPALPLFNRLDFYATAPGLSNLMLSPTEEFTWNCWEWTLPARR